MEEKEIASFEVIMENEFVVEIDECLDDLEQEREDHCRG